MRRTTLILAAALVVLSAPTALGQRAFDRWYRISIDEQPSGSLRHTRAVTDDGITTSQSLSLSSRRGSQMIEIELSWEFVETVEGRPVSMRLTQRLGSEPTTTTHLFRADSVIEITEGPAGPSRRIVDPPDASLLPPSRADAARLRALRAGDTEIVLPTLDPLTGLSPVLLVIDEIERAEVDLFGATIDGWSMTVRSSEPADAPPSLETLAADGTPVRIVQPLGAMRITLDLIEPDEAGEPLEPAELLVSTFVTPDRPIRNPRRTSSARYVLTSTSVPMPELPTTGVQRFERVDDRSCVISVDLSSPVLGEVLEEPGRFLAATTFVDADDPEIEGLVGRLLRGMDEGDAPARAERLRRAVYRLIAEKDLSSGFATASETVRSRAGDCTEHAVLLAAALREAGIPSRVASGLIYADRFAGERDVFAFHMWTQAWLDTPSGTAWVDLDATLPRSTAFDATHITLGTDSLQGGIGAGAFGAAMHLIGTLDIEVERVE